MTQIQIRLVYLVTTWQSIHIYHRKLDKYKIITTAFC